jgi:hypothetical protein
MMIETQRKWYIPAPTSLGWNVGCAYTWLMLNSETNLLVRRSLEFNRRHRFHAVRRIRVCFEQQYGYCIPELVLNVLGRVGVLDWERDPVVRGRQSCRMNEDVYSNSIIWTSLLSQVTPHFTLASVLSSCRYSPFNFTG